MALDQQLTTYEEEEEGKEMTFLEHLEELRWHLIRSVAAIVILSIAVFIAKDVLAQETAVEGFLSGRLGIDP